MAYDTTEAVAKFLSGFQMKITNRERDTVAPDYYVKYSLTLSKGGKDFSTTFVSDGEPTVTQVFSALADDALTLRKYSTDEFVDKLYAQGVKPSAALRAYDSCKETNLWMQDELYLSGWEIEEISKTLTKYEDEVNTLVEKAASERAARYAYDHPKLPKGFVTIEQLQGDLDLGDLRDAVFAAHRASYPLVEFYDTSQDAARFPGGQFVSRYYMTDLLEDDSIAVSLDTMLKNGRKDGIYEKESLSHLSARVHHRKMARASRLSR